METPKTILHDGVPHPVFYVRALTKEVKPAGNFMCFEPTQEFVAITLLNGERHVWFLPFGTDRWEKCL